MGVMARVGVPLFISSRLNCKAVMIFDDDASASVADSVSNRRAALREPGTPGPDPFENQVGVPGEVVHCSSPTTPLFEVLHVPSFPPTILALPSSFGSNGVSRFAVDAGDREEAEEGEACGGVKKIVPGGCLEAGAVEGDASPGVSQGRFGVWNADAGVDLGTGDRNADCACCCCCCSRACCNLCCCLSQRSIRLRTLFAESLTCPKNLWRRKEWMVFRDSRCTRGKTTHSNTDGGLGCDSASKVITQHC